MRNGRCVSFCRSWLSGNAFWIVLIVMYGPMATMPGQTAKTVTHSAAEISAAGPDDPEDFLRLFAEMMRREQFGAIDAMVAADRVQKSRFPGGGWKLYSAYLTLSRPALPLTAKFSDAA